MDFHCGRIAVLSFAMVYFFVARSWELILRRVVRRHLSCILLRLQMLAIEAGRLKEGLVIIDESFIQTCILYIVIFAHWPTEVFSRKLYYEYVYQMFVIFPKHFSALELL